MLVAVEADAVAQAVGEEFVVGAVAGGGDDFAGGVVNGAAEFSGAGGVECGVLRVSDNFENLFYFLAGGAEYAGAGDFRLVAFEFAAAVDEHDVAFFYGARFGGAVR